MQFIPSNTASPRSLSTVMDRMQGGFTAGAHDYQQQGIDLNALMVANPPATYFVRASGDFMIDAGIRDGDLLVVDFSQTAKHGDIVLARLDDSFATRRLYKRRGQVKLYSENRVVGYAPIVPQEGQTLEVVGVVSWVVHKC